MVRRMGEAIREAFDQPYHHPERARPPGTENAPLFNDIRRDIYFALHDVPGVHLRKLCRLLGIDTTTAKWHLDVLVRNGLVVSGRRGKYVWFAPSGIVLDYTVLSAAQAPHCGRLLRALKTPMTISEISVETGLGVSNLYSKVRTLEAAGLVRKEGGVVHPLPLRNVLDRRWREQVDAHVAKMADMLVSQGILVETRRTDVRFTLELDLGSKKEKRFVRYSAVGKILGAV